MFYLLVRGLDWSVCGIRVVWMPVSKSWKRGEKYVAIRQVQGVIGRWPIASLVPDRQEPQSSQAQYGAMLQSHHAQLWSLSLVAPDVSFPRGAPQL